MDAVTFDTLDAEWQRVKDTLQGTDLGLRMRRATSWIECAAKADDDTVMTTGRSSSGVAVARCTEPWVVVRPGPY